MIRVLRVEINCRMKRTFLVAPVENVVEVLLLKDSLWFYMSGFPLSHWPWVPKEGFMCLPLFLLLGGGIILVNI